MGSGGNGQGVHTPAALHIDPKHTWYRIDCPCGWSSVEFRSAGLAWSAYNDHVVETANASEHA